jgi:hypothetical protein
MNEFDTTTVSVEDLQTYRAESLLAEADVIIAVDAATREEEIVCGQEEWEESLASPHDQDLTVLRVELDMETRDLEWLMDAIEAIQRGADDENGDEYEPDAAADE